MPPIMLCLKEKERKVIIEEEFKGIELWNIASIENDIDYEKTFHLLLEKGANPNISLTNFF